MKEYLLNTKKQSCTVNLTVTVPGTKVPVFIWGYDPLTPCSYYFKSTYLLSNQEQVTINCPQSPRFLKVLVWNDWNIPFDVSIGLSPLQAEKFDDPWIRFIENFSKYCGIYWPGKYYADNVDFIIDFRRVIYNEAGKIHTTPARISTDEPVIQASKQKFDQTSIPGRIMFLFHEVSHNYINNNPDDESEADSNGAEIYDALGYPEIEKINAFADIMPDTDDNYNRMINLTR